MMASGQFIPSIVVLGLVLARASNPALRQRITWTTVGLMAVWALISLTPGQLGLPPHVVLFIGYIALASLIVNGVAVLGYIFRRLTTETNDAPTPYTRIVRVASVAGIAVILFIVTVRHF